MQKCKSASALTGRPCLFLFKYVLSNNSLGLLSVNAVGEGFPAPHCPSRNNRSAKEAMGLFCFLYSIGFVLYKISSRRFIAGDRHRGLAWCLSAEDETGCSHRKVPHFGHQKMRWSLLPGFWPHDLGCVPSALPAYPSFLRTTHFEGSSPEVELALTMHTTPSTEILMTSTGDRATVCIRN